MAYLLKPSANVTTLVSAHVDAQGKELSLLALTAVALANLRRIFHAHLRKDISGTKLIKIKLFDESVCVFSQP